LLLLSGRHHKPKALDGPNGSNLWSCSSSQVEIMNLRLCWICWQQPLILLHLSGRDHEPSGSAGSNLWSCFSSQVEIMNLVDLLAATSGLASPLR